LHSTHFIGLDFPQNSRKIFPKLIPRILSWF